MPSSGLSMYLRVLGSAAGGGFPQWNCNCPNCDGLRRGTVRAQARTQSSIALSANGIDWLLVNASPDILTQIRQTPLLQPARAIRDSGIAAVLLMDAQIDHVTGLLMLRESSAAAAGHARSHCRYQRRLPHHPHTLALLRRAVAPAVMQRCRYSGSRRRWP